MFLFVDWKKWFIQFIQFYNTVMFHICNVLFFKVFDSIRNLYQLQNILTKNRFCILRTFYLIWWFEMLKKYKIYVVYKVGYFTCFWKWLTRVHFFQLVIMAIPEWHILKDDYVLMLITQILNSTAWDLSNFEI